MKKVNTIDIIIPMYNEEDNILNTIEKIGEVLNKAFTNISYILVDDGSMDKTEQVINRIEKIDGRTIKYIKLSKNFGKDIAIKCGIDHSEAPLCVIMDADLQHPPEKILEGMEVLKQGYNIVHIVRKYDEHVPLFRKWGSQLFKKLVYFLSGVEMSLTDFKLLDRKAVRIIKDFREVNYFNRGVVELIGLKAIDIYYEPNKRMFGDSRYSFFKLLNLAIDGLISVSVKPLRLSIYFGFIISSFSILYALYLLSEKLFFGQPIPGFTTLGVALFFLSGIQLMFLGIIGEYLGKTFLESKRRPQYVIESIKEI